MLTRVLHKQRVTNLIAFPSGGRGTASAVDEVSHQQILIAFVGGKTSKFGFANASLREGGGIFVENDEGSPRNVRFLLILSQRMLLHRLRRSPLPEGAIRELKPINLSFKMTFKLQFTAQMFLKPTKTLLKRRKICQKR